VYFLILFGRGTVVRVINLILFIPPLALLHIMKISPTKIGHSRLTHSYILSGSDLPTYLPMWPSGQRTRLPCAVEHDALSGRSSRLSLGLSAYQRIISNNSYAHDEQGVSLGR